MSLDFHLVQSEQRKMKAAFEEAVAVGSTFYEGIDEEALDHLNDAFKRDLFIENLFEPIFPIKKSKQENIVMLGRKRKNFLEENSEVDCKMFIK